MGHENQVSDLGGTPEGGIGAVQVLGIEADPMHPGVHLDPAVERAPWPRVKHPGDLLQRVHDQGQLVPIR
jgi:hypothetical protein